MTFGDLQESGYGGIVPAVPSDVGRKYQVWPLMPGLLCWEMWTASYLALMSAFFECSSAFSVRSSYPLYQWQLSFCAGTLVNSVIQCSYLVERKYILSWTVNFLLVV